MANVTPIAGLDVSKQTIEVCLLDQGERTSWTIANTDAGIKTLFKRLPPGTRCIMEATGPYYLRAACRLHEHQYPVSVVNPLVIRRYTQMLLARAKTDRKDAELIACYGADQQPRLWTPPSRTHLQLQQLWALLGQVQKQRTALQCQQEAFAASGAADAWVMKTLRQSIARLQKQEQVLEQRLTEISEAEHGILLAQLTSTPGIGKKAAVALLLVSDGFRRFASAKQLAAYAGLCPRIYQSGTSVRGRGRICKMGAGRLRTLLYLCSWSAKRCNQQCRELYERLLQKGKSKK